MDLQCTYYKSLKSNLLKRKIVQYSGISSTKDNAIGIFVCELKIFRMLAL